MRLSLLACIALTTAILPPVHSLEFEARAAPSVESKLSEGGGGWGIFKHVLNATSQVASAISDEFNSLSASAHKWYDGLHLADAGGSLWVKVVELGQSLDADVLLPHAMELHPPEKVHEFKQSVDIVISTATELHQMVLATAEQNGVPPDSVKEEFGAIFNAISEKLQELFPPPAEAPGHENRTVMVNAALDFIDGSLSQFAIKLGASEESIKVYSDLLKSHVQIIVVTIGDLIEQHPKLALTLVSIAMIELRGFEYLLTNVLKIFGFGPLGIVKGSPATWVQRWFFPSAIPKGGWFAALQRLAMTL